MLLAVYIFTYSLLHDLLQGKQSNKNNNIINNIYRASWVINYSYLSFVFFLSLGKFTRVSQTKNAYK